MALADDLSTAEGGLPALEAAKASAGTDYQAALDDKAAAEILSADADALLIQRTNEASQAATDAENAENAREAQQTVAADAAQAVIDAESVRVATEGALQDAEGALKEQQDAVDAINVDITAKQADKAADEASLGFYRDRSCRCGRSRCRGTHAATSRGSTRRPSCCPPTATPGRSRTRSALGR